MDAHSFFSSKLFHLLKSVLKKKVNQTKKGALNFHDATNFPSFFVEKRNTA